MNFKPTTIEANGFDVIKEINGIPLRMVYDFCEDTGAELDISRGIVRIARGCFCMTELLKELGEISKLLQLEKVPEARKRLRELMSRLETFGKI